MVCYVPIEWMTESETEEKKFEIKNYEEQNEAKENIAHNSNEMKYIYRIIYF